MKWFPSTRRGRVAALILGAVALGAAACMAWGFFIEPDQLVLHREEVSVQGLPPLRIVLLSDLHGGAHFIDRAKLDRIVELANAQKPDLVFLLGDYVTGHRARDGSPAEPAMPVEDVAAALAKLRPRRGTYAVLGNHDFWFDARRVREALLHADIRVLEDEAIPFPGARDAWLVGLADQWEGNPDLGRALGGIPNDEPTVVLVHEPDVFPELPSWVSLTLAGHTHGGQVSLPLLGALIVPSKFGTRYAAGWVEERGRPMFVTTGIGTSIMPVRFRVPPEVVLLEVNAPSAPGVLVPDGGLWRAASRVEETRDALEFAEKENLARQVHELYGERGLDLLRSASRVEAYRVAGRNWKKDDPEHPDPLRIGGYPIVAQGADLAPDTAARLKAILLSNQTYSLKGDGSWFWAQKLCGGFEPGVAFRFERAEGAPRTLDVLLCFKCNDIGVVADASQEHRGGIQLRSGEVLTTDMSAARRKLLHLSAEVFPTDATLEALVQEADQRHDAVVSFQTEIPDSLLHVIDEASTALPLRDRAEPERQVRAAARNVSPTDLVRGVARVLGKQPVGWAVPDSKEHLAIAAVDVVEPAALASSFEALQQDPVAMRGAARLFFRDRYGDKLPDAEANVWAVRFAEVALRDDDIREALDVIPGLARHRSPAGDAILERLSRGEILTSCRVHPMGEPWSPAELAARTLEDEKHQGR